MPTETGEGDWLDTHPERRSRPVLTRVLVLGGLAAAVAVGGVALAALVLDRDPDWPTRCGVDGRSEWCGQASRRMTDPALAAVVGDYCPGLAGSQPTTVVPQPLSLADLGAEDALARTTGSPESGTEDSLLGVPSSFSWVTRWVGGDNDGRVELRCPGMTEAVPSLRLAEDQFRSTVAASRTSEGRHIDFAAVAESSVRTVAPDSGVSWGLMTCDTTAVDLADLAEGETFACQVEAYSPEGKGLYRFGYRVTSGSPYFEPDSP
ncbi:MAG: hypothetical protein ACR2HA_04115 [Nocardioides sp.]